MLLNFDVDVSTAVYLQIPKSAPIGHESYVNFHQSH